MSDIQRWDIDLSNGDPFKSENGDWIEYADYVAAVAAAQREGANQGYLNGVATNADNSFKAGVKAAREAIRNTHTDPRWNILQIERSFLAAIDGVKGEQ